MSSKSYVVVPSNSTKKEKAGYLFKFFLLANFLQYLEAGAVPAMLLSLSEDFDMGHGQQGLLGGVVYIALSVGGPFAGNLLRHYDAQSVVGYSVVINNIFTLMWAFTPVREPMSKMIFIILRFIMGLAQCVLCVYMPLWINEFAPRQRRTTWMGYLQASVPLGVMTGLPFIIEVILVVPLSIYFNMIPKEHMDISPKALSKGKRNVLDVSTRSDASSSSNSIDGVHADSPSICKDTIDRRGLTASEIVGLLRGKEKKRSGGRRSRKFSVRECGGESAASTAVDSAAVANQMPSTSRVQKLTTSSKLNAVNNIAYSSEDDKSDNIKPASSSSRKFSSSHRCVRKSTYSEFSDDEAGKYNSSGGSRAAAVAVVTPDGLNDDTESNLTGTSVGRFQSGRNVVLFKEYISDPPPRIANAVEENSSAYTVQKDVLPPKLQVVTDTFPSSELLRGNEKGYGSIGKSKILKNQRPNNQSSTEALHVNSDSMRVLTVPPLLISRGEVGTDTGRAMSGLLKYESLRDAAKLQRKRSRLLSRMVKQDSKFSDISMSGREARSFSADNIGGLLTCPPSTSSSFAIDISMSARNGLHSGGVGEVMSSTLGFSSMEGSPVSVSASTDRGRDFDSAQSTPRDPAESMAQEIAIEAAPLAFTSSGRSRDSIETPTLPTSTHEEKWLLNSFVGHGLVASDSFEFLEDEGYFSTSMEKGRVESPVHPIPTFLISFIGYFSRSSSLLQSYSTSSLASSNLGLQLQSKEGSDLSKVLVASPKSIKRGGEDNSPFPASVADNVVHVTSSDSESASDDAWRGFTPKKRKPSHDIVDSEVNCDPSVSISVLQSVMALLGIRVYRYLIMAMTALYFTVTGVQYWGTSYLELTLNAPPELVHLVFIVCAASGPTSGVFFGGWLIDHIGGYKGARQRVIALEACCIFGVLACLFASPITFSSNIYLVASLLWLLLFFGGAILPGCSGMIVAIVPKQHRPISSSLSLVVFNFFGYFLSLVLSGFMMQIFSAKNSSCDGECALKWGFRLVLFWSYWSLLFLSLALLESRRIVTKRLAKKNQWLSGDDEESAVTTARS